MSTTVGQYWTSIGSTSRVCWVAAAERRLRLSLGLFNINVSWMKGNRGIIGRVWLCKRPGYAGFVWDSPPPPLTGGQDSQTNTPNWVGGHAGSPLDSANFTEDLLAPSPGGYYHIPAHPHTSNLALSQTKKDVGPAFKQSVSPYLVLEYFKFWVILSNSSQKKVAANSLLFFWQWYNYSMSDFCISSKIISSKLPTNY